MENPRKSSGLTVCKHKARHKALESVPGAKHCRQSISHQLSINGPRPKPCHSQGCEWQAFAVLWNEIKGKCLTYKTYIYIHICGSEDANMTICSCMFSNSLMISNKTEDWIFIDFRCSKVKGRGALGSGRMMNIHSIQTRFHLHRGGTQSCLSALGMTHNLAVSAYFEAKGCNINRFSVSGPNLTSSVWERWKCCKHQKS